MNALHPVYLGLGRRATYEQRAQAIANLRVRFAALLRAAQANPAAFASSGAQQQLAWNLQGRILALEGGQYGVAYLPPVPYSPFVLAARDASNAAPDVTAPQPGPGIGAQLGDAKGLLVLGLAAAFLGRR